MLLKHPSAGLIALVVLGWCFTSPARAQASPSAPTAGNVAAQFKSGANNMGDGAAKIGEGIKQGAFLTWASLKNGASAVASTFSGGQGASTGK